MRRAELTAARKSLSHRERSRRRPEGGDQADGPPGRPVGSPRAADGLLQWRGRTLVAAVNAYIEAREPGPFTWTGPADAILQKLKRFCDRTSGT